MSGQLPHRARHVRLRVQFGHQTLDLAIAPPAGAGQDGLVILRPEVLGKEAQAAEVDCARLEQVDGQRILAAGPYSPQAVAGGVLGEFQHLCAVVEEPTVSRCHVERGALTERVQQGDGFGCAVPFIGCGLWQAGHELPIRERFGDREEVRLHGPCCNTAVLPVPANVWMAPGAEFARDTIAADRRRAKRAHRRCQRATAQEGSDRPNSNRFTLENARSDRNGLEKILRAL